MKKSLKKALISSQKENFNRGKTFYHSMVNVQKALEDGDKIFIKLKIDDTIYPDSTNFEKVIIAELSPVGLKVYQKNLFSKEEKNSFFIDFDNLTVAKIRLVRYLSIGAGAGVPDYKIYTIYEISNNSNNYKFICESIKCVAAIEEFYNVHGLQLDIPETYKKMFVNMKIEEIRNKVIEDKKNFEEIPIRGN